MYSELSGFCLTEDASVLEAIGLMDRSHLGIVLVVDDKRRLIGTVTDGDVRRAILRNLDLKVRVTEILDSKAGSRWATPVSAPIGVDKSVYLNLLKKHEILHLPLLDSQRQVVGLVTLDEFVSSEPQPLQAVIVAGGAGTRLRPLTDDLPKALLPIGSRPLMEIMIDQLREAGIRRVNVTTHHKGEKIADHFGDGRRLGVELRYVTEDQPLGTAGGLGLMDSNGDALLVINGDILTQVDFRAMVAFHRAEQADLTVAVRPLEWRLPYGVVECEGVSVRRLTEKPVLTHLVNAGIYLLEPSVHRFIPDGRQFDMTDLIERLLAAGRPVAGFPIHEYWLDIGRPEDYQRAQIDAANWEPKA